MGTGVESEGIKSVKTLMNNDGPPRQGVWSVETTARFWDYFARHTELHDEYFSKMFGEGIVELLLASRRVRQGMSVLDYGCGPGFLLAHLLEKGLRCWGLDTSEDTVAHVERRFKGQAGWGGARVAREAAAPYADESFDAVICIETLEHVLGGGVRDVVEAVRRLVKPGGVALFTAPNEEKLEASQAFCPFCNTEYHRYQHQRSFSAETLRALLEASGFRVLFCRSLYFGQLQRKFPHWSEWSYNTARRWVRVAYRRALDRIAPRPFPDGRMLELQLAPGPHLCALAVRDR